MAGNFRFDTQSARNFVNERFGLLKQQRIIRQSDLEVHLLRAIRLT